MSESAEVRSEPSLRAVIGHLAGLLSHGGGVLSSGDIAALRRMDPRTPAPAFFKLAGSVLDAQLPKGEPRRTDLETRWAAVLVSLAHLGDLHDSSAPLGEALVAADLSEFRFVRLLRADSDGLVDGVPALASFLAAKGVSADFSSAAWLLLSAGRADQESCRRQIARSYYAALARKEATPR